MKTTSLHSSMKNSRYAPSRRTANRGLSVRDVAAILGLFRYRNEAIRNHVDERQTKGGGCDLSLGQRQPVTIINRIWPRHSLILSNKLPTAKQTLGCFEVLPSIRKTGEYKNHTGTAEPP